MNSHLSNNRRKTLGFLAFFLILMLGCTGAAYAGTSAGDVASQMTAAFRKISSISSDLSIVMGACIFVGGLYHMKRYGEARTMMSGQLTFSKPLMPIVAGTLLMSFPSVLGTVMRAFWGADWSNPMAYQVTGDYDVMVPAMLSMVRLLGVVCLIRAILCSMTAVGPHAQPGAKSKVGMLLVAGLLCVNVTGTLHLLNSFFHFSDKF
jgi:intracellular multiplication protein IcmC